MLAASFQYFVFDIKYKLYMYDRLSSLTCGHVLALMLPAHSPLYRVHTLLHPVQGVLQHPNSRIPLSR